MYEASSEITRAPFEGEPVESCAIEGQIGGTVREKPEDPRSLLATKVVGGDQAASDDAPVRLNSDTLDEGALLENGRRQSTLTEGGVQRATYRINTDE